MAVTKDFLFDPNERKIACLGKALMHPGRVRIIHALLRKSVISYPDLLDLVPLYRSTVDDHLRTLERFELVERVNMINNLGGYSLRHNNYRAYLTAMGGYLHPETRMRMIEGAGKVG